MAIIAGVNIPDNQRLEIALTAIYGIGRTTSKKIVGDVGMGDTTRARDLTDEDLARVRSAVERTGLLIEGDLRRETQLNIRRLTDIQTFRGVRHRRGLPVRGQRTKTNARTKRGRRQTVAGRKRVVAP
ncbi:MAG TPA: 30S ribosomal protein S13 [Dehalococcoidia bacterium]|nr:30S ribosomal protein S13 [Chloroflexota bacterium]MBU96748.1 30S ribosomal protein S13 [Dehalococcoidia bacterium]MQG29556.1 30S ribosomal protein S13 [SAR202 cluster bacterium]MEE2841226.1 30S ribosomal protein S13 [Chloroflexota bacterium]HAG55022.1 30S ribosomal protein S13 [Dehalococcoidia bacterium]